LELTQGTDITELFETHHITQKAELLLPNFYIREAKTPRNYRTTFVDDGFYKTLKEKVADQLKGNGIVQRIMKKNRMRTSDVNIFSSFIEHVLSEKQFSENC
jgi:hypothetical protein